MSNWLMRMAVFYLVLGVVLGNVMGASHDHTMTAVHAHLNLLGFAVMMLAGLWFKAVPAAADSHLARTYFWLHQFVFPVQMVLLWMVIKGNTSVDPALGLCSVLVGVGILCLAINVWQNTRA